MTGGTHYAVTVDGVTMATGPGDERHAETMRDAYRTINPDATVTIEYRRCNDNPCAAHGQTADPMAEPCADCGADAGEPCGPDCLGLVRPSSEPSDAMNARHPSACDCERCDR